MVKWTKEILEKKGFKVNIPTLAPLIDKKHFTFNLIPIPKPRMTRRDKWLDPPRSCVARYWKYKDEINRQALQQRFTMPESDFRIIFYMPMPKSWTAAWKDKMAGTKHQQKGDLDNLTKAFFDAICVEDKFIWDCRATKLWAREGKIEIILT